VLKIATDPRVVDKAEPYDRFNCSLEEMNFSLVGQEGEPFNVVDRIGVSL
jgi:hypothetical protein